MKCFSVALVLLLFGADVRATEQHVSVELEWEEMLGARTYEVEFLNKSKEKVTETSSATATMKVRLRPGVYFVRGRVLDRDGSRGKWSPLKEFLVPPKSVTQVQAPVQEAQVAPDTFVAGLPLKWVPATGAAFYKFKLLDQDGKVLQSRNLSGPEVFLEMRPGLYSYEIVPVTADGVEGEAFVSAQPMVVKARPVPEVLEAQLQQQEAGNRSVQWRKETALPTSLRLEYQKHFGGKWMQIKQEQIAGTQWQLPADSRPGNYRISLWHRNRFGDVSSVKSLQLVVKPREQDL